MGSNRSALLMALVLLMSQAAYGGPGAFIICQTGCNAGWVACYAAAGAVAGTVTAGVGVPAAIVACNVLQGACMAACAGLALAPTPWTGWTWTRGHGVECETGQKRPLESYNFVLSICFWHGMIDLLWVFFLVNVILFLFCEVWCKWQRKLTADGSYSSFQALISVKRRFLRKLFSLFSLRLKHSFYPETVFRWTEILDCIM